MTRARRRAGARATPAMSARIASTGSTTRSRSSSLIAVWALARLSLWSTTNCALTTGILSAKGTPRSTSTGLICSMNGAEVDGTWPLVTTTAALFVSPVSAATTPACASRLAATQASWKALGRHELAHLVLR